MWQTSLFFHYCRVWTGDILCWLESALLQAQSKHHEGRFTKVCVWLKLYFRYILSHLHIMCYWTRSGLNPLCPSVVPSVSAGCAYVVLVQRCRHHQRGSWRLWWRLPDGCSSHCSDQTRLGKCFHLLGPQPDTRCSKRGLWAGQGCRTLVFTFGPWSFHHLQHHLDMSCFSCCVCWYTYFVTMINIFIKIISFQTEPVLPWWVSMICGKNKFKLSWIRHIMETTSIYCSHEQLIYTCTLSCTFLLK